MLLVNSVMKGGVLVAKGSGNLYITGLYGEAQRMLPY
jgi:hypothetical protein